MIAMLYTYYINRHAGKPDKNKRKIFLAHNEIRRFIIIIIYGIIYSTNSAIDPYTIRCLKKNLNASRLDNSEQFELYR